MKKLFAVLISLTLILMMGAPAFAEETTNASPTGKITITNALEGEVYTVYKMFDFTPVAGSETQGRYTVVAEWADFLKAPEEGAKFLKENTETGTIEWVGEETDARKAELAKAAVAYAKNNSIAAAAQATAGADGKIEFTDLGYGYYAIDTTLGTVCALTNVDAEFVATDKNEKPSIDKQVQEDSEMTNADGGWGSVNDAAIGQDVKFKATITVGVGAINYVMHDKMDAGLSFNNDVVVKLADGTPVDAANYTVTVSPDDGDTFDVTFNNDYIAGLAKGTTLTVEYSATLDADAIVATDGNDNKVVLSYGEDSTWTMEDTTTTYTWKMDVLKYVEEGDNKTPLAGAQFQLLDENDNAVKFTKVTGEGVPTYKVAADGEATIITDTTGKFVIVGLDEGKYQLDEIMAPAGYNKIAAPLDVVITSEYDEDNLTATYEINDNTPATIEVENKTGSLLPETGGIGTTIFYVVGGVLMLAAVIILIAKKRMNSFA